MGFYIILDRQLSLAQLARNVGSDCACALHFHPQVTPGEPDELDVQGGDSRETVLIQIPGYIEEDVRPKLSAFFGASPVRIFLLTYGNLDFLKRIGPFILNDNRVWVLSDKGLISGQDFLRELLT